MQGIKLMFQLRSKASTSQHLFLVNNFQLSYLRILFQISNDFRSDIKVPCEASSSICKSQLKHLN